MIIPKELTQLNQWVLARPDIGKQPWQACRSHVPASVSDSSTWDSYFAASNIAYNNANTYPGFVLNNNGIVGIDIDAGHDEDGFISPLAADIISACRSYTEESVSGRGYHIFVKGDIPFAGKNNLAGVEIYKANRYLICTGKVTCFDKLIENQEALDYILEKYFPESTDNQCSGHSIYQPIWDCPDKSGKIKLRPTYPGIPQGCRNICLTSLAGMLHAIGYNQQQVYNEISYANACACEPALPDDEVIAIARSVSRYRRTVHAGK